MISDNGTTFVAAADKIKELFESNSVHDYLSKHKVQWNFIPSRAPWFGGFYERLIGITKTTLKKTLGQCLVNLDELVTILVEVEAVINDRPITYLSAELELDPLTPSQFLCGRRISTLPHKDFTAEEIQDPDFGVKETDLRQKVTHLDQILSDCWRRWKKEYLPALREMHKSNKKGHESTTNKIKKGDVVLVHSDIERRLHWPLAIVTEFNKGKDGLIRPATIRTKNGICTRPITKLYPLELNIHIDNIANPTPENSSDHNEVPKQTTPVRDVRKASGEARDKIQNWIKQIN